MPRSLALSLALLALAALVGCESNEPSEPELHNRIVFLSDQGAEPLDYTLYSMAPDGSDVSVIDVGLPLAFVANPVVSPDGRWLAFEHRDDIYVADVAGGQVTNLTQTLTNDGDPTWSPDGERIAFSTDRAGSGDIYVMNRDGTEATRLTDDPGSESMPAWSPDGTRIAYHHHDGSDAEIYVVNVDGSNPVNLTNHPEDGDYRPAWSHDGTRIAFVSDRPVGNGLFVMDADGDNVIRLGTVSDVDQPVWSPDDQQLVFERFPTETGCAARDLCRDIYVINLDGSGLTNLTQSPDADDVSPFWSR